MMREDRVEVVLRRGSPSSRSEWARGVMRVTESHVSTQRIRPSDSPPKRRSTLGALFEAIAAPNEPGRVEVHRPTGRLATGAPARSDEQGGNRRSNKGGSPVRRSRLAR